MNMKELERLLRKYYGYIADMEGSGVETLDLLFVRDKIQSLLDESTPEKQALGSLYEQVHTLDSLLWTERAHLLVVIGEQELQHARQEQRRPRSHWWWYLDELCALPQPIQAQRDRIAQAFVPDINA